jgi:murein DD-endopeptidase MepM/ murein hydrolase activator NlpD
MLVLPPPVPARTRTGARMRALTKILLVVSVVLAVGLSPAAARGVDDGPATAPGWSWPVPPPIVVVAPYRAPPTPYAAGHRGIDLAVEPGAIITAAAGGTVSFAGAVAGRGVVSIDHGGGVVSAIEPVAAALPEGAAVSPGDVIGTASSGGHCSAGCVHFGVRVDGEYVSPFLFLGGLPRAVLLPMG